MTACAAVIGRRSTGRQLQVKPAGPASSVAELERLARQVARLSPSHRDPERFHLDRSEIVAELRRLAAALGRAA